MTTPTCTSLVVALETVGVVVIAIGLALLGWVSVTLLGDLLDGDR